MRRRLFETWTRVRSSYWFIPSLMTAGAIALSAIIVNLDNQLGVDWIRQLSWLYENQPDGARAVLSTVAGSMITVAGVTFSMTLLAVSHASSQMGPRLLANFMRDTGNQVTLGTFIATFVYCLLILRTVRTGVDGGEDANSISPFVPHLGILLALALALGSVAVLIYFIHHVPQTINVSHVIGQTGDEMLRRVHELFPQRIGESGDELETRGTEATGQTTIDRTAPAGEVGCERRGYIRRVDGEMLMSVAREHDLLVEVLHHPGEFVYDGEKLMRAWPESRADAQVLRQLEDAVSLGTERNPTQDLFFAVDQLVEVATRALSPGVNDPFTAIECIHQLECGLIELVERRPPDTCRYDADGALRVIAEPLTFDDIVDRVLDNLRAYAAKDMLVNLRLFEMIERVARETSKAEHLDRLQIHLDTLSHTARDAILSARDEERLEDAYRRARHAVERSGR